MNLVVPTEQLGSDTDGYSVWQESLQVVLQYQAVASRCGPPAWVEQHILNCTCTVIQNKKKTKQHHTSCDSKARPSGWPGCRTCFVHDINTSTGVLHRCFKGGERHAQHMDSWAVQQMSHWGEFSSGQGNTRLKPVQMTCWGFTEQVGGGRRTSWSPGASPEEAGAHVEAPLSHPVITPSLFLILGYSGGAVRDCSSPKTMLLSARWNI